MWCSSRNILEIPDTNMRRKKAENKKTIRKRKNIYTLEHISVFKEGLAKAVTEVKAETKVADELREQLDNSNQKYRQVISQTHVLKSSIDDLQGKVEKLTIERINIEQRLIKTRASLTYQLSYVIKNSTTSFRGFVRLPLALWRIYRQALKLRKIARQKNKQLNKNISASTLPTPALKKSGQQIAPTPLEDATQLEALQKKGRANGLKVACIMDEFTYGSFAPECDLHQLTPASWKSELVAFEPEMLFIESAWRGKEDLWGSKVVHNSNELQGIVQWCRDRSISTVFWNKEDPVHFQSFLNTAMQFDYVFTTDIDCISRYKATLGHEQVYLLPFACQPATHNPIELYERKDAISFAGAYYVRYPERANDLECFLDALPAFKPVEIYDRNYGKGDPNYQFPEKHQPFIVGTLPFDKIDQAYKGYQYAINLNSIKQSQSMFARRIYEVLASNTITISNFSRGVRLLFGDLVITSDNGNQIVQRLQAMAGDADFMGKFKLVALRKVMLEHTYQQRLNYICAKVSGISTPTETLPSIAVLAKATSQIEAKQIIEQFKAQTHKYKHLILVIPAKNKRTGNQKITYLTSKNSKSKTIKEVIGNAKWIASMSPKDYYGPNYLLDIAIASQYSVADLIGKAAYFQTKGSEIALLQKDASYRPIQEFPARQAALKVNNSILLETVTSWLKKLDNRQLKSECGLAIDPYNYCRSANNKAIKTIKERVDDLASIDKGLSIDYLQSLAESIPPAENTAEEKMLDPVQLTELLNHCKSKNIDLVATETALTLTSRLSDGKHDYLYAAQDLKPETLFIERELKCYLDTTPGLAVSLVFLFLDGQKQRIKHVIFQANYNGTVDIPPETEWLRIGLRVLSAGETEIKGLVLGHRDLQPEGVLGKAEHLLLTNHYPSYHDLYRNGFVHSRVKAYAEKGVMVDVFRLRMNEPLSFDEFEGTDVLTGGSHALEKMLKSGRYKSVLVHFLSPEMWAVLEKYIDNINIIVWIHGAEIQPWHRREYNYKTDEERALAKLQSDQRMGFWRNILQAMPKNLQLVFVSNYLANVVMEDFQLKIPEQQYHIIHNPINTDLFSYQGKTAEQRKKLLSIRPYTSRTYANDLTVEALLELSKEPWFSELEICLVGDGPLFDETLSPLKKFSNITIEKRYLAKNEIAQYHKEYGIFLCPSRMDTQGVSRDEAMASGLVPVTNAVAAIPEFTDDSCAILVPEDDAHLMAEAIKRLYGDSQLFLEMSKSASQRIKETVSQNVIVKNELSVLGYSHVFLYPSSKE